MKKVGIIGYGAFGKQIENFLNEEFGTSSMRVIYFDDLLCKEGGENAYPFDAYLDSRFQDLDFFVGLGYKHLKTRKVICDQVLQNGLRLPFLVHRTTYVNPSAKIGDGVYIYPMSTIDQEAEIKTGVIINNAVIVSHNAVIDTCTFIAPGVTIAGSVSIGKHCFIGAGSVIANNITIGDKVSVGLGSAVTKNVGEGSSVIGNPLKYLEKPFILK